MPWARRGWPALVVVSCASAAWVALAPGREPRAPSVTVTVTPARGLWDADPVVRVSGLKPGESVQLRSRVTDADGSPWAASATFRADSRGRIDTAATPASAGSYTGRSRTGLLWSMRPVAHRTAATQAGVFYPRWESSSISFSVRRGGRRVARTVVQRQLLAGDTSVWEVRERGLRGTYFAPPMHARKRSAIVIWGGSEGGDAAGDLAGLLAAHGHPVLTVAYFGAPGLPNALHRIPIEYFARAVRWIDRRPGVDGSRTAILGVSRGSEAALLLAAHYPDLVGEVIAVTPSSKVGSGYPAGGIAWTLRGRPLRHAVFFDAKEGADSDGVIPVERIRARILLGSGADDRVWPSADYARAIERRLARHGRTSRVDSRIYEHAGHYFGIVMPNVPIEPRSGGGTFAGNATAAADLYRAILQALDRAAS